MKFRYRGRAAVLEQQHVEAPIARFAQRRVDANLSGYAENHEIADTPSDKNVFKLRGIKRAAARLVDDRIARLWRQVVGNLPPRIAADQVAANTAVIADTRTQTAAAEIA